MSKGKVAYTLIETLVVISIIAVIATMSIILIVSVRTKANDTKRKAELSQIGKFFTVSCYTPDAGAGTYDLIDLINELRAKDEKYRQLITKPWRDPKSGTDTVSKYTYIVTDDKKCVLYANLENNNEDVTLNTISSPTPGGGTGVFASSTTGYNGSTKYFQISN